MKNYKQLFKSVRDKTLDFDFMPRSFGRMHVDRAELVKPYLHYIDESRLSDNVKTYMNDGQKIDAMYMKAFKGSRKINRQQLVDDTKKFYDEDFPKELSADIYNLYNKEPSKLDFEERQDKNKFRYKILDTVIDPIARVISKDSHMKSMIMTRSMIQYFSMLMAYQKQVDPEEFEKMKNALNSKSDGGAGSDDNEQEENDQENDDPNNGQNQTTKGAGRGKSKTQGPMTAEEVLEKLMKNDKLETLQDEIMDDAKNTIEQLSKLSNEELDSLYNSDMLEEGQSYDHNTIMSIIQQFLKLKMDMSKVKPLIQKLLDKSKNYFNGKETTTLVPFLDAEALDSIQDLELLHPKLRRFFMDDIMVKDSKKEGKIDIYIDISGSMGATMAYNESTITGIDFAKAFAIQMINMNLIRKVYLFDTSIHEIKATALSVSTAPYGGGTYINTVVEHINKENNNAIVITDACDRCSTYSPFAYFIGIVGASFNYFDEEILKTYSDHAQMVEYDGQKIFNINSKGKRVK